MRRILGGALRAPAFPAIVLAILLFAVSVTVSSGFASSANLVSLTVTAAIVGFAALGQTFVVLGGGIDLSVPWLIAAGGVGLTQLSGTLPVPLVVVVLIIFGAVVGVVNGMGVTRFNVPPIVMTLGVGGVVEGAVIQFQKSGSANSGATPPSLVGLVEAHLGSVSGLGMLWLVIGVVAALVLRRSAFGRRLYATGSNDTVALLSGIRAPRIRVATYAISGVTAVVAGVLLSGFAGQAFLSMGSPYLFTSIAAVAIGGVSLLGGSGSYWGSMAGALVLTLLTATLPMFNLGQAQLKIVYGAVILIGVVGVGRLESYSRTRRNAVPSAPIPKFEKTLH
jgi:ribose transport system permease protein